MAKYKIPVGWMVTGEYEIEADSLDEAFEAAQHLPLPDNNTYISDSFEIYKDEAHEIPT